MDKEAAVIADTSAGRRDVTPLRAGADETPYVQFLIRLMRIAVALIVAGFIFGGIGAGYDIAHRADRSTEWIGDDCASTVNADGTCGYKPRVGAVIGWSIAGGTGGLLAGLVATFGIETTIVVFLAARRYLRS
ncbi:MAG TPA: hypothetical protein VHL53_07200 [Acidimicrobiia bacterium]|nr:hypothetical protein [Acidimicrobiia bacterium]